MTATARLLAPSLSLLSGCHASTLVHVPNFDGHRMPEPIVQHPFVPESDHRAERVIRIPLQEAGPFTRVTSASLRVVARGVFGVDPLPDECGPRRGGTWVRALSPEERGVIDCTSV